MRTILCCLMMLLAVCGCRSQKHIISDKVTTSQSSTSVLSAADSTALLVELLRTDAEVDLLGIDLIYYPALPVCGDSMPPTGARASPAVIHIDSAKIRAASESAKLSSARTASEITENYCSAATETESSELTAKSDSATSFSITSVLIALAVIAVVIFAFRTPR